MSTGYAVELDRVTKTYATNGQGPTLFATRDVTLEVEAGGTVALTGTSGSGKSTLLHLIGGMDVPSEGRVRVGGRDLGALRRSELADYRRSVGFVFQRFHLLPTLTVRDNVLAPLLPLRHRRSQWGRVDDLIERVGLRGRENALPSQLSGGQQQRVAIARALVNDPRLLLADEPTGNLDSATGTEILDLLFELHAASGMTVVMATHDVQVATRCDRIVRLADGRIDDDTTLNPTPARTSEDLLTRVAQLEP